MRTTRFSSSFAGQNPDFSKGRMERELFVLIERDADGGYVASVPSLRGCHTQSRSLDELMERVKEAATLCLHERSEEFEPLSFVGIQRIIVAP